MSVAEPVVTGVDTAAAERLYERNSSRVFGYCLKMLGTREEAEDASQTTFMQAFRALQRGVVPVYETAWLLTIAKNVCRGRHRASGRRKAVELVRDPQDLELVAGGPDRESESLVGLQEALARLPEMQRRAFLLREWQGRSYAEIAVDLGVTVPAVEALIFRARKALALDLGGEERRRGHAFDLASILAALKSLLGGGAAVKVAVGAATVVGVGAVAGGAAQERVREPVRSPGARVAPASAGPQPSVRTTSPASAERAPSSPARVGRRPAAKAVTSPAGGRISKPVPVAGPARRGEDPPPQPAPDAPAAAPQASPAAPAAPETPVVPET
ncbi:MAG TPA: RNA polymerase sigma factor, partial [Gaiellaceae bacterium]|nr:RNA polymerase sigma factor [Gaiellaceae bacterium]